MIIATQEPTVSPALLDLCNVTIIHRFNSPAWFKAIEGHIAGATSKGTLAQTTSSDLFQQIVRLATGEALVFCPTALLGQQNREEGRGLSGSIWAPVNMKPVNTDSRVDVVELGSGHVHLKIRKRITADGGRSILA